MVDELTIRICTFSLESLKFPTKCFSRTVTRCTMRSKKGEKHYTITTRKCWILLQLDCVHLHNTGSIFSQYLNDQPHEFKFQRKRIKLIGQSNQGVDTATPTKPYFPWNSPFSKLNKTFIKILLTLFRDPLCTVVSPSWFPTVPAWSRIQGEILSQ